MPLTFPCGPDSLTGSGGLLSNNLALRRRQISRINAYVQGKRANAKQTRAHRKALYKHKMNLAEMSQDARDAEKSNPLQHGAPRCFKILIAGKEASADAKLHDADRFVDEGHFIYFAAFGIPQRAIRFNDKWIDAENTTLSADRRVYTLEADNVDGTPGAIHLDFTQIDKPVGQMETANGFLALSLQPWAVAFNVNVSANTGAYYSSAQKTLIWNETSDAWKSATWEQNSMVFSYDTVMYKDPFGGNTMVNEVSFEDPKTNTASEFTLKAYQANEYTAIFKDVQNAAGKLVQSCITTIKQTYVTPAPAVRATDSVKSVFPQLAMFTFDDLGGSFTGAFTVPQAGAQQPLVYGVVGTGILSNQLTKTPGLVRPEVRTPPVSAAAAVLIPKISLGKTQPLLKTSVEYISNPFALSVAKGPAPLLPVTGLTNFDPMVPDPSKPTQFMDSVSATANKDFHDIICYWMDSDIHKTFISSTPTTLADQTVTTIATDSSDNATFYKTLQVPYVTSILANSTLPEGKQCNGVRADAQLKTLPANSPTYQRHSDALYRHRYMQAFPNVQNYLDDQAKTDYTETMTSAANAMKARITTLSAGVNGTNAADSKATLAAALADIDSLRDWATSKKLFYAFYLYYWCENFFLPQLMAQVANGALSASVARTMKKLTLIFGVLENGQQNAKGKSFVQAFNDLIRLFQMSTVIPQFVDADAIKEDFDSLQKEMLQRFYDDNIGSSNPKVVAEAQHAKELANNDFLRHNFFDSLATSMRLGGSLGSWSIITQLNAKFLNQASWYQKLVNGAEKSATFMRFACVSLLVMPMINSYGGGWGEMTTEQRVSWVSTSAALGLTFFLKGVQGVLRLTTFWDDLAGFTTTMKAFMGFKSVLSQLPQAAVATENTLARWFLRGSQETMELTGAEVSLGMKIFGRSLGEFLTNSVGAVLAGINIVMSAIDLAKTTDPLQKDMDIIMIVSSGLQLLAIAASWLVAAAVVTDEIAVSVLSTAAAILGPLAIAFAIAGLVIMIVMALRNKNPPNPVQDFVDKHAAPKGLKMEYGTAIDYFNVVPPDSTATSLNGITFQAQAKGSTVASFLQLGVQSSPPRMDFTVIAGAAITYLPDTCWNVKTDSTGVTTVWTYYTDSTKNQTAVCLSEGSDGNLHMLPPPAKSTKDSTGKEVPVDPSVYAQQISMQQWKFVATSSAITTKRTDPSGSTTFVTSASFTLQRGGKLLVLKIQSDGSKTLELDTPNNINSILSKAWDWTLTLQSMGPSSFSYIQPKWGLTTTQKDEHNGVVFTGPTSQPLTWTITPALPSYLTLSATDGTISQATGVAPSPLPATVYSVTATITILGKKYSKSADVTITITDASAALNVPPATSLLLSPGKDSASSSGVPTNRALGLRSRFAVPQISSNSSGSSSTAASKARSNETVRKTEQASDNPTRSELEALPLDQLQSKFDSWKSNVSAFFDWQQAQSVVLNQHYTAHAAIARIQNSLSGSWEKMTSIFTHDDVSYESIYFPSPTPQPPPGTNDPIDYHGTAQAFVAQCIYNGDGYAQQYCNLNNASNAVSTFNQNLWSTNTQRFIDWMKDPNSMATTGPRPSLSDYQECLESSYWVAYKRATQASGTWTNQSHEMYFHFLKLAALGATQDQINETYTNITGPDGLVAGGFSDITPSTWMSYTGYILTGPVSYSQVGVQNLNQTSSYYVPGAGGMGSNITQHADTSFIRQAGYYQSPPSGCCFPAGTQVVLADGRSTLAIEKVVPGMCVLSPTQNDQRAAKAVKLISRPKRDGRPLYCLLAGLGATEFTATHPILLRHDGGSPVLGFVDVAAALRLNPLWGAFRLESLPMEAMRQSVTESPIEDGKDDTLLYDLIFESEPSQSPTGLSDVSVFVISQAPPVDRFKVCTEAPDITALPALSRFVLAFLKAVASRSDVAKLFPHGLRSGALDYTQRVLCHRAKAAAAVHASEVRSQEASRFASRFGDTISLESALSVIGSSDDIAQSLMDASEAIISTIGLGLQSFLDNGWHFLPSDSKVDGEPLEFCLSMHELTLAQESLLQIPKHLNSTIAESLQEMGDILLNSPKLYVSVSVSGDTLSTSRPSLEVNCRSIGPCMHRVRAPIAVPGVKVDDPPAPWSTTYSLAISVGDGSMVLTAEGQVVQDVPAMWPLHIKKLTKVGGVDALRHQHVGWVSVTGAVVSKQALDVAAGWTHGEGHRVCMMDVYAEALGAEVGQDIVKTLFGDAKWKE